MKVWRQLEEKYDDEAKWNFLFNLKTEKIFQLFHVEINGDLLGKFLVLFEKRINKIEMNENKISDFIYELLSIFPKCNRFSLSLMFLKNTELDALKKIFNYFEVNKIECEKLKKDYIN